MVLRSLSLYVTLPVYCFHFFYNPSFQWAANKYQQKQCMLNSSIIGINFMGVFATQYAMHRCAIPAWINQYQYLILKNQVSIPISISIFQISEIDTNFNTPDLENQYKYQYQYLSFENSIPIPIPILKILSFNINLDLNTKVLQYSECKNF